MCLEPPSVVLGVDSGGGGGGCVLMRCDGGGGGWKHLFNCNKC